MADQGPEVGHRSSPEAVFRYAMVSQVLLGVHQGGSRSKAVSEVARREQMTLDGRPRRVSESTLHRWVAAYEADGLAGLDPVPRPKCSSSQVLPPRLLDFAAEQKKLDVCVSIPEILKRARELGILRERDRTDRTTVYRALKRAGVSVRRRKSAPPADVRRWAMAHRMQMALSDGKHFRAGVERLRRVALFFLDDATRYGLDVVVGTSENTVLFLRGVHAVTEQYGLASAFYLDGGPGFISHETVEVVAKLGALLIHGTARYPEGHGKIERFNRTVKAAVLRGLDRRPDVDPDCGALTLRLRHWLKKTYNHTPHESLGNQTPFRRFHDDTAPLRYPESRDDLQRRFVIYLERTVSTDHVVSVDSVLYEMPRGYAEQRVVLHRRVLSDSMHFLHQGRLIQLHPVDLTHNAHSRRGTPADSEEVAHPLPPSAADLAFNRDFRPVVGPDGGFSIDVPEPQDDHDKEAQ